MAFVAAFPQRIACTEVGGDTAPLRQGNAYDLKQEQKGPISGTPSSRTHARLLARTRKGLDRIGAAIPLADQHVDLDINPGAIAWRELDNHVIVGLRSRHDLAPLLILR